MKALLPCSILALFTLGAPGKAQAQMTVQPAVTVDALVLDIFQGSGVTISGATINNVGGSPMDQATGHYLYAGDAPIPAEGVILSTGMATDAAYPPFVFASTSNGFYQDWDLSLLAQQSIVDATVLEFNFVPDEDQMMFEYVFASEEYPEFVCTNFNDVFGFFLSGPDISGPYQNGAVNVALLPDGYIPVSINTVNGGVAAGDASNCAWMDPDWQSNSQYFVDNENGTDIVYDGFTTILQVSAAVTPGQQHRLKIGVADASDAVYDSAIFLQAASFRSVPSLATQLAREQEAGKLNAWFNDQGLLTIDAGAKLIEEIRVLDMNGRLVAQQRLDSNGRITVADLLLPTGVYILEAHAQGRMLRGKLAKG
jgi:hypothetical protein